jgi:hypothetical protein
LALTAILIGFLLPAPGEPLGSGEGSSREAARLRRHFASVEGELLARDVSGLTPAQRAARGELVRLLHGYAARGAFPRNDDFPGLWVPYFRDRHGNLCAMAFLIAATGRGDIVDHVARTLNNAYVPELVDEPGLAAWLRDHGLTVEEAARIQPEYGGPQPQPQQPQPQQKEAVTAGYAGATGGATALVGTSLLFNLRSLDKVTRHRGLGAFGIAAGGLSIGLGVSMLGDYRRPGDALGIWNIGVGSVAAILGARALFGRRNIPVTAASAEARFTIIPVAAPGRASRLGVAARLRL